MCRMNLFQRIAFIFLLCGLAITPAAFAQNIPVAQDAYFSPATATNFGSTANLNVGGPKGNQAVVQFDLSSLPAGTTGANVAKATLVLFVNRVTAAGNVNFSLANGGWKESTLTGTGSYPVSGLSIATAVPVATAGEFVSVDATQAVQDWLNGGCGQRRHPDQSGCRGAGGVRQ